ncbi:hypothetical protein H6776_00825 [Candidatus Nomurabacteria bacterium]|nr:hypothetical protein [Candidatus Nomurabacteria bacterium]
MKNSQRIFKSAWQHMTRNGTVTFASVFVLTVTLLIIALLIFTQSVLSFSLEQVAQKVDVNVYFLPNAPEEVVLDVQDQLLNLEQVASVEYVSRDAALESFRERHANDSLTLQALEELGENPLGSALNIRAHEPSQYEDVAEFLSLSGPLPTTTQALIEKVNYYQNERIIERVRHAMGSVRRLGMILSVVFGILSILITFNTLRLAMYASREEISIMQMVGARRRFVQGPLYFAGMLYGVFAAIISIIILYPLTSWMAGQTSVFFGGFNIFDFFISNFLLLAVVLLAIGIILGVLSSALALWMYLDK